MMSFVILAAIFGFAAVFAVPWVSGLLGGFVPTNYKSYLPSSATPALGAQSLVGVLVYGALLAVVLLLFKKVGISKSFRGIEA